MILPRPLIELPSINVVATQRKWNWQQAVNTPVKLKITTATTIRRGNAVCGHR